ncbi:Oxidoreductase, N-terminal [Candidatus Nanopelagicaceae bacterium]
MQAILVGFGSVGKRHLQQLEKRFERVIVVDPYVPAPTQVKTGTQFFRNLQAYRADAISTGEAKKVPELAVIANWGPDHFASLEELLEIGIRKFLVEKPLASRISDLDKLESLTSNQQIQIWSNFHLRYDQTTDFLRKFVAERGLPSPSLMTVSGGAKCLATTGIHWIDYFLQFSKVTKYDIQSRILTDWINPRSKDLAFLEGFIHLSSEKNSVNLVFTNHSYSDASVELFWETFKIQISEGKFRVLESQNLNIAELPITRTQPFDKLIYESDFGLTGLDNLYDSFLESKESMDCLFLANRLLLQSLIFSESCKQLPDEELKNLRDKDYLIS